MNPTERAEYLAETYADAILRLSYTYLKSTHDAQDVCQTVFLKLLEQGELTPGKEKAWLMQVTANACRSLLRSHWWRTTVPLDETVPAADDLVDETIQALGKLKSEYRVVLYLHYYEQYTASEIGHLLKIPASTVTTRLDRGRKRLKKLLEEG